MGPDRTGKGASASPPVDLHRVLEEEFAHLHGKIAAAADGDDEARLASLYGAIHALPSKRAALCLSGGGIRSATFALGVLQGLARAKVLTQFDYLSTVSGGGYIGGWLTAWIHRAGNDVHKVAAELAVLRPRSKLEPEPAQIAHLRDFSNYLSPRGGLLSSDTWTLIGTVLRNVILIWLVLVPLLAAGLMLPRLYLSLLHWANTAQGADLPTVLLVAGAALLGWAIAYIAATLPSSTTARRSLRKFLGLCLLPLVLGLGLLTMYWATVTGRSPAVPLPDLFDFVRFGAVVQLVVFAGYSVWLRSPWGQRKPAHGSRLAQFAGLLAELLVGVVAGAVGGAITWLLAVKLFGGVGDVLIAYATLAPGLVVGAFLLAATALVGLLSRWSDDDDREWWARCGAWFLIAATAGTVLSVLVLCGPVLFSHTWLSQALAAVGGVSGLITVVGGWLSKAASPGAAGQPSRVDRLSALLIPLAGVVFAVFLVIAGSTLISGLLRGFITLGDETISAATSWGDWPRGPFDHVRVLLASPVLVVAGVALALAGLGLAAAWFINTNRFSLHGMYRSRLIRAYLGASNPERHPDPFTGFDDNDNLQLHQLWPRASDAAPVPQRKLLHVVNMALNLVHGERLAWQERKAYTFTASALHAGSLMVGYRRTRVGDGKAKDAHYAGKNGMSLGTAIAISGAAASPNMGYHSSPLVTFLMTLFNVRLGWWLGNPGVEGDRTYYLASPRLAVRPIVAEALGLTGSRGPYVYLSDGGHFENLGLYEMVLRRCHFIVVSDASCDERCEFQDLGNAVRKIRTDLGVPIDFDGGLGILPRSADPARRAGSPAWALGRIRYSIADKDAPDGWLLYIKPALDETEPLDVREYAMSHPSFPHESTGDQFFTESQFESYRMLGLHVVQQLSREWKGDALAELIAHLADRLPATGSRTVA